MSCCASVLATTNSTPCRFALIMLSTALVPPPPTPITVIRGVKSVWVVCGIVRLSVIRILPRCPGRRSTPVTSECSIRARSHAVLQKIDQPSQKAGRLLVFQVHVLKSAAVARGPGQQARGGRKGRPGRQFRQAADRDRPAKAHLPSKNPRRHFAHAGQLARASGQHHAVTRRARQPRTVKPV